MVTYNWSDLLAMNEDQIWAIDNGQHNPEVTVVAADKSFQIGTRPLIASWYCWPFHKTNPGLVLERRHFLTHFRISNKTIRGVLTEGYNDYDRMVAQQTGTDLTGGVLDVVKLNSMVAKTINHINNAMCAKLPAYVTTGDMPQYIEILDDPVIKEIRENLKPNQNSIGEGYRLGLSRIKEHDSFPGNQIADDIKQAIVSDGQTAQVFIARGYLTDHDSRIFVRPVLQCYAEGFGSFYDSFVESRSATKAMIFTKKPLEDSEWFNRKLQLVAQSIRTVHLGEDCGSTITVPVLVRKGWVENIAGKYYVDDDGQMKMVHATDKHLEGRTLQLRSPLYCNHSDKSGVCERCYGKLAVSIPYFNVLGDIGKNEVVAGHVSATEIGQALSQKMLGTKHHDTSSTVDPFIIRREDYLYLSRGMRDNAIRLNPRLKGEPVVLKVCFDRTTALSDVAVAEDLDEVATRVGGFSEIVLEFQRDGGYVESIPIRMSQGSRQGQFTVDFLRFLQKNGWRNAEKGYIEVDLDAFNYDIDIVELPLVHEDMMAYQKAIEAYIRFSKDSAKWKGRYVTPEESGTVLGEFFELLRQRLNVNIVHAEMILYSVTTRNPAENDYRLPRATDERQFSSYHECIEFRSLSVQLLYQEQAAIMVRPSTFLVDTRQPHVADSIFL